MHTGGPAVIASHPHVSAVQVHMSARPLTSRQQLQLVVMACLVQLPRAVPAAQGWAVQAQPGAYLAAHNRL